MEGIMKLSWFEEDVPDNIEIHQIYAVVFNERGEVLLKQGDRRGNMEYYALAGGTPELYDKDLLDTLRREYVEEMNTTIKDPVYYLGYQLVDEENGIPPYAQVRITAMVDTIGESLPDPDCGVTYKRVFAEPNKAIRLLNWGDIGERIIRKSVEIAKEKFGLTFENLNDNVTYV